MNSTKSIIILISIFLLGLFLGWFAASDEKLFLFSHEYENALVTQITDGDTIVIEGGARVRLLGINTPEKGEDYYSEAKQYLKERILMKEVRLERDIEDRDMYGRLLRYVWLNDTLINAELAEKGLANAYFYSEQEKYKGLIAEAEKEAMEKKINIWSQLAS